MEWIDLSEEEKSYAIVGFLCWSYNLNYFVFEIWWNMSWLRGVLIIELLVIDFWAKGLSSMLRDADSYLNV
jgi:hypothetical protein